MLFCIRLTNFIQMRPLTVEIWRVTTYLDSWLRYNYFRFLKRSPYRNSTSGFDFDHITVMCMLFCTRLPNFVQLGAHTAEIWRHVDFSKWRPRPLNTTSAFVFVDVTAYRRSNTISKPNFVNICQLSAEIELLPFWKKTNVCHIWILLPVSISVTAPQLACYFASCCRILSKSDHPQWKYDAIFISQDDSHYR